jgi:hypothetical protein
VCKRQPTSPLPLLLFTVLALQQNTVSNLQRQVISSSLPPNIHVQRKRHVEHMQAPTDSAATGTSKQILVLQHGS